MRKLLALVVALFALPLHAQTFNLFKPAAGILKGQTTTYVTTAAASSDVISLWTGTCNSGTFLSGAGTCISPGGGGLGTVTSIDAAGTGIFSFTGGPITTAGTLTLVQTGTSGGIPYFSAAGTLSSSAALTANRLVLGGGAATTPSVLGSLGTTTTLLHGNAAGAPTFAAVSLTADVSGNLPVTNLNSGTSAGGTTFWRGDGTWATPAGGGTPGGSDTQVQYNSSGSFAGSAAHIWNDTTHSLLLGNQGTPPVIGTIVTGAAGTAMTMYAGDCSSSGCSPSALTIRGGEGQGSANGSNVTVRGGNGNGAGTGGNATFKSGDGSSGGGGGTVSITGGSGASAQGGRINMASGTGSSPGPVTISTGNTDRITMTGSAASNAGIQFNGYTAGGVLTVDTSGNVLAGGTGTTASIGGGALLAGACASNTATITGATTSMVADASPATYPGDGNYWLAYVSASNTITVKVCAVVAGTPTASTYNVRLIR